MFFTSVVTANPFTLQESLTTALNNINTINKGQLNEVTIISVTQSQSLLDGVVGITVTIIYQIKQL